MSGERTVPLCNETLHPSGEVRKYSKTHKHCKSLTLKLNKSLQSQIPSVKRLETPVQALNGLKSNNLKVYLCSNIKRMVGTHTLPLQLMVKVPDAKETEQTAYINACFPPVNNCT